MKIVTGIIVFVATVLMANQSLAQSAKAIAKAENVNIVSGSMSSTPIYSAQLKTAKM